MEKPRIDTSTVYTTVANLLPAEGRDFTIDAAYTEDGKARLIITPLTAIGRAWVPFLQKELESPMQRSGVAISTGGTVASEVMTINSVRAKIEAEAEAAMQAKVKAAKDDHARKVQIARDVRAAQVAKEGEESQISQECRNANRAANDASVEAYRLTRVASKINGIRASIDEDARKAAKDDEKNGKFWAIDMNAPLTSLFDQQDVTSKFRSKESIIMELAKHAVEVDDLRERAVNSAKQYIIQKEG